MATDWNCLFHRSLRAYIFCNCFSQLLKTKHSNLAICFAIGNVMSPIISINSFVIFSRCWLSHHSRFVTELVCFKRKDKLKILRQFYTIDCPVKGQYSKFSIISGILTDGWKPLLFCGHFGWKVDKQGRRSACLYSGQHVKQSPCGESTESDNRTIPWSKSFSSYLEI